MKLTEHQTKFVQTWGTLGTNWGINKTMAQLHALLMVSHKPLSTEDMMELLKISRGNTNMNVRNLVEWGLAQKEIIAGDRKDFYSAKKDIWVIAKQIAKQRRIKELEPVLNIVREMKTSINDKNEDLDMLELLNGLEDFTGKVDKMLEKFVQSDENWFYKVLLKLV